MTKPIAGDRVINPNDQATIDRILATIRIKEGGSKGYTAINKGDGVTTNQATGAYQFLNSTWKGLTRNTEVASQYPAAYQAPPSVQDFVAESYVLSILATHGYQLASVPVTWYYPRAWGNDAILDTIPAPNQGNTMTVRAYAEAWIKTFDGVTPGTNTSKPQVVPSSSVPGGIGSQVWDAVSNPFSVFSGLTSMVDLVKAMFEILTSAGTWIRVLKILGGMIAIGMGLWIVTHDQPVKAGLGLPTNVAKVAAVA